MIEKARPLILGHRGVVNLHQENTLAGFRRARELGIDGVELDVQLTKDGKVVVFHDDTTERLTGVQGRIKEMTWDEVSKLRVQRELYMGVDPDGSAVIMRYAQEERIPLLAEVLAELGSAIAINIELKPAKPSWSERKLGRAAARVIRDAQAEDTVIVTSFDFFKLRDLEAEHAPIHSGFAYDDDTVNYLPTWLRDFPELPSELAARDEINSNPETLVNAILEANTVGRWIGSSVVAAEHTLLDSNTIERFRERGMAFGSYTIFPLEMTGVRRRFSDEEHVERLRWLCERGGDWVETDDPERAMTLTQ
ncbi:MAG: hypothetical protein KC486_25235 [Myxococcales bacterium]|nr:hypothetical protein [Myxococcales bacterium]